MDHDRLFKELLTTFFIDFLAGHRETAPLEDPFDMVAARCGPC
jgi:hypothetical protein